MRQRRRRGQSVTHKREIPRDLFNEAKLLKCLGQLALLVHDEKLPTHVRLTQRDPVDGFHIEHDASSGDLFCKNVRLTVYGSPVDLLLPMNSRDPYPLLFADEVTDAGIAVFHDDGSLTSEFLERVNL